LEVVQRKTVTRSREIPSVRRATPATPSLARSPDRMLRVETRDSEESGGADCAKSNPVTDCDRRLVMGDVGTSDAMSAAVGDSVVDIVSIDSCWGSSEELIVER